MVWGVTGDATIAFLAFFTLLCHYLVVSRSLKETSLRSSRNILILYSFLLCLISVISYKQSVIIGGELTPYLAGSDGEFYFELALAVSGSDKIDELRSITGAYFGYQTILSTLLDIFGKNLFVGLLLNNTLVSLTVLTVVRVTWLLTKDKQNCFYSALAFILTTKIIYYSNILLKDPFLCFGVALVMYMVAKIHDRKAMTLPAYLAIGVPALIFGMMRQPMLVIIPFSFLALGRIGLKIIWLPAIIFLTVVGSFTAFIGSFTTHSFAFEQVIDIIFNNQVLSNAARDGSNTDGIVGTFSSVYGQLPILIKMVLILFPAMFQFILPFNFWSTKFLDDHLIDFFNVQGNVIWYLFIGVFMVYGMLYWKRLPRNLSKRLFLVGVALYLANAFVFGGVVPRYSSPYLIMMFPTIGYLMSCLMGKRGDYIHIKRFFERYYYAVFTVVILFLFLTLSRNA
tara:strand:+ start:5438 stop:6799 length:1362 start_codon:yes stop_codon:yes gene_type:complete